MGNDANALSAALYILTTGRVWLADAIMLRNLLVRAEGKQGAWETG